MNLKSPALAAVFKAAVVAGAFAITSTVAATAIAALNPRDQGMAVDLSAKIYDEIQNIRVDVGGEASAEANKAAIVAAIYKVYTHSDVADTDSALTTLQLNDPDILSAALMMVAVRLDIKASEDPGFFEAFRSVQQTVLAAAIVERVQDSLAAGGTMATEEAIAAEIADTISAAGVPASLAQASLTTATTQLSRANISTPALTTALSSVQAAVQTAQTIQTTNNQYSAQAQVQVATSTTVITVYVRG